MNCKMRKLIVIIVAFIGVTTLHSCVIKKYKSPDLTCKVDSLYRTLEMAVDTNVNSGMISWREFFTDKVLQEHIDTMLNRNLDFLVAKKEIDKAYSQLRVARAAFAPTLGTVSANGSFEYNNSAWGASAQTGASWEIDIWGKILSNKRAALAGLQASEDALQALQTQMIAQMANGYYQLVTFDIEKEIIRETIQNRAQYLDTIRLMKTSGKVNEVAVQQAVAQLSEVLVALPKIEMAIIKTENAISLMLGKTSSEVKRTQQMDFYDSKVITEIGIPAQLLSNRPDVRQAEQQFRREFELYNVSRAAMYPSLTINANAILAPLWNPHFTTLGALAALTQPLWNGRKLRSQKEIADINQQQTKLKFQNTVLKAGKEVSDAMTSQIKTLDIANAQKVQLQAYDKAYQYSFELFVNGYATYLDVLTAQTGVYNTKISLLGTYYDNIAARIELYRTLGGGAK